MEYKIDWIIPTLRKPVFFWKFASCVTVTAVGVLTKLFIRWFNKPKMYNTNILYKAIDKRPRRTPLITVSNHHSCFDDPGLWVLLNWNTIFSQNTRWSLAAQDICFTNSFLSYFFMLGKCVPVIRGKGVFQDAVNYCIELLSKGEWLHLFPEGKVNATKEFLRFKWGIGRMIYESPEIPIIIPIWHIGMDEILPNHAPYYVRTGKCVTFNIGEPIDLADTVTKLKNENASSELARKIITDRIQCEMYKLKEQTEELHRSNYIS